MRVRSRWASPRLYRLPAVTSVTASSFSTGYDCTPVICRAATWYCCPSTTWYTMVTWLRSLDRRTSGVICTAR